MKYFSCSFLFIVGFLFSCKNEVDQPKVTSLLGSFKEPPTQFSGNKELAYQQLNDVFDKLVKNRTTEGKITTEQVPTIISHTLGIIQQFPSEKETIPLSFRAAELLAAAEDYENAAKMYQLITISFPKGEKVGHATIQLGIILDKHLGNKAAAIKVYRTFLKEYLDHPFVGAAEGLLYELVRYDQKQ